MTNWMWKRALLQKTMLEAVSFAELVRFRDGNGAEVQMVAQRRPQRAGGALP